MKNKKLSLLFSLCFINLSLPAYSEVRESQLLKDSCYAVFNQKAKIESEQQKSKDYRTKLKLKKILTAKTKLEQARNKYVLAREAVKNSRQNTTSRHTKEFRDLLIAKEKVEKAFKELKDLLKEMEKKSLPQKKNPTMSKIGRKY